MASAHLVSCGEGPTQPSYGRKEEGGSMLEIEGDNKRYQIQKCNNLRREFPPIIDSSLLPPDPSLEVSATTLQALPPALHSSKYVGV